MKYPILRLAHRGASGQYPENTLLSFRKAIEYGVEYLEMDLHLTSDHEVVVIHDETLERTTNGSGFVWDHPLRDIQQLNAGQNEHIPTLYEVIELVKPTDVRLCLELKYEPQTENPELAINQGLATTNAVLEILDKSGFINRSIATSFSPIILQHVRNRVPRLPLALDPTPQDGTLSPLQVMEQVFTAHVNIVAYYFPHIDKAFKEECLMNGVTLWAWDPDDPREILRLIKLGVQGIMTNRPDLLNQVLSETHFE